MRTWSRYGEVIEPAHDDGPQHIAVDCHSDAVVLSVADFDGLCGPVRSLVDFMQASPLTGLDEELVFDCDWSVADAPGLFGTRR